ncbi:MAG: zinc-finger domain-containing protein [Arenicellales bacterium]|jgi:uncharacterized Zn-finger protein
MQNSISDQGNGSTKMTSPQIHNISKQDLPVSCPLPSASQWNAHPRVFLALDDEGKATCPYCSTVYILQKED